MITKVFMERLNNIHLRFNEQALGFRIDNSTIYSILIGEEQISAIKLKYFLRKKEKEKLIEITIIPGNVDRMGTSYDICMTQRGNDYVNSKKFKWFIRNFHYFEKGWNFLWKTIIIGLALIKLLEIIWVDIIEKIF